MARKVATVSDFTYDPDTGTILRNGKACGYKTTHGYLEVRCDGRKVYQHRLAYRIMTGYWPKVIDHINRDTMDNRWCNLRNVTQKENTLNISLQKNNTSGHTGVCWCALKQRWKAYLSGKSIGSFLTKEEAIIARGNYA